MRDKRWHVVWIDEEPDGFAVRCIPHGFVGARPAHVDAFLCALEHDFEITGDLNMSIALKQGG